MKQLESLLDRQALTVTGRTVAENLAAAAVHDDNVIRPLTRPFADKPSIVVLHGSLAPESAIVKLGVRSATRKTRFSGPAKVYDNPLVAIEGIQRGEVTPGQVLVARGMGPKGGPAMAGSASRVVFALDAAGLQDEVAFVCDGQLSGLCLKGLTVAEVSPESAVGGPLSLVQNGDRITIDVDAKVLDLDISESELSSRRERARRTEAPEIDGLPVPLPAHVQPMSTGAVLVKRD